MNGKRPVRKKLFGVLAVVAGAVLLAFEVGGAGTAPTWAGERWFWIVVAVAVIGLGVAELASSSTRPPPPSPLE